MILINLLPPELRKRRTGVSPAFLSLAVGGTVNALLAVLWVWLAFSRMHNATVTRDDKNTDLTAKKARADQVLARKQLIQGFEERRDRINDLLARKIYWAHTLDDFANLVSGQFPVPGFDVCVQEFSVKEAQSAAGAAARGKDQDVLSTLRLRYKLVGASYEQSGEYLNSFFKTTERSPFWTDHGFEGKPEDRYSGDQPKWNDKIKAVIVDGTLDWQRRKVLAKAGAKPAAPAVVR